MSTAKDYVENLPWFVAWDGHQLRGYQDLPRDLSFRSAVSAAFSPRQTIDEETLWEFFASEDGKLHELLRQAIRAASKEVVGWVENREHLAPENIAAAAPQSEAPTPPQLWAARLLIFQQLVAMPEFKQLYGEFRAKQRRSRKWLSRLISWGERQDQTERKDEPLHENTASVWGPLFRETYRPLMQGIMYVLPFAIGSQLVASSIIEKQSEVRSMESRTIRESDFRSTAEISSSISRVNTDIEKLQSSYTSLDKRLDTLVYLEQHRADNNPMITGNVTLKLDPVLQDAFLSFGKGVGLPFQVSFSPDTFHVRLANDKGDVELASNSTGKPTGSADTGGNGLLLNVGQSDFNLHEGPYPIPAQAPQPPFVKVIEKGEVVILGSLADGQIVPVTKGSNGSNSADKAAMVLCDDSVPYTLYLRIEHGPEQVSPTCPQSEDSTGQFVFLTEADQYVANLSADMKVDAVSTPRHWLFGNRRVAIRITPVPSTKPAPKDNRSAPADLHSFGSDHRDKEPLAAQ